MTELSFPCVKNKCLKYPVCRSKALIKCDSIDDLFESLAETRLPRSCWKIINRHLPKAVMIDRENLEKTKNLIRFKSTIVWSIHDTVS